MMKQMKALAVLAAASMALGALAGCASGPSAADYAGTYLFDSMTTAADGQTTTLTVGDEANGSTVSHGFAVSTLNEDGTCTLDMSSIPGEPMKGTWTAKSDGAIEIVTGGQVSEAMIEGDTLTTPSTFDADGKTLEMSFVFKKSSSATRSDYAGEYRIQKIVVDKGGKTEEYNLGDEYQGTTLAEDTEISRLNADGTCSLESSLNKEQIPDGVWRIVGDGEIEIEIAEYPETDAGTVTTAIENGTLTQTLKTGDGESTAFTYAKK